MAARHRRDQRLVCGHSQTRQTPPDADKHQTPRRPAARAQTQDTVHTAADGSGHRHRTQDIEHRTRYIQLQTALGTDTGHGTRTQDMVHTATDGFGVGHRTQYTGHRTRYTGHGQWAQSTVSRHYTAADVLNRHRTGVQLQTEHRVWSRFKDTRHMTDTTTGLINTECGQRLGYMIRGHNYRRTQIVDTGHGHKIQNRIKLQMLRAQSTD